MNILSTKRCWDHRIVASLLSHLDLEPSKENANPKHLFHGRTPLLKYSSTSSDSSLIPLWRLSIALIDEDMAMGGGGMRYLLNVPHWMPLYIWECRIERIRRSEWALGLLQDRQLVEDTETFLRYCPCLILEAVCKLYSLPFQLLSISFCCRE